MSDEQKAVEAVLDFLNDDTKKTLLVRGYDSDAKIRVVLYCLDRVFDRGIIRTSSMSNIPNFINRAFEERLLPDTVKSTTAYDLGRMTVHINSYVTSTKFNPKGNDSTFTLFFPVQNVLSNPKRYNNFLTELENTKSRKVILITTNEWSINDWDVENYVDEVFFYSVEEDNPQIMRNLRNNGAI
ncbi:hypothetical protein [Paenibacillus alvei]|uniref:hypothetical protein n=1 Tax=Paenibacillus alvei TaxID=44250 RepID=UPI0013DBB3E2|nr:hypothetical protein [Paenibacillus alvei]NEZ40284.1 hypothetical protein [Paenibacillus alvei]